MLGYYLKWFSFYALVVAIFALFGVMTLFLVLKLPWDLYFQAKDLIINQQESLKNEIDVSQEDLQYALKAKTRLLILCLVIHAFCAGLAALISYQSQSQLGYYFSFTFLISTLFRPLLSYFQKEKERLFTLKNRSLIPREDSLNIKIRLDQLEHNLKNVTDNFENDFIQTKQTQVEYQKALETLNKEFKSLQVTNNEQYEKVLNEFTKAIEKLTEDQELLRGIRAMVKLLKEDPR